MPFTMLHRRLTEMTQTTIDRLPKRGGIIGTVRQTATVVTQYTLGISSQGTSRGSMSPPEPKAERERTLRVGETVDEIILSDRPHETSLDAVEVRRRLQDLSEQSSDRAEATHAYDSIDWRYVHTGSSLLLASWFSRTRDDPTDNAFEQRAFVDSLTYFLKALPQDGLSKEELRRLNEALPPEMTTVSAHHLNRADSTLISPRHRQKSLLRLSFQRLVVVILFILGLVLPYILTLVRMMARFERKHRISEQIVSHGMEFVNSVGTQGVAMTGAIYNARDGEFRRRFYDIFVAGLDDVTTGIQDGVKEGLVLLQQGE